MKFPWKEFFQSSLGFFGAVLLIATVIIIIQAGSLLLGQDNNWNAFGHEAAYLIGFWILFFIIKYSL